MSETMATSSRVPRRRDAAANRERLLDAAKVVFGEQGPNAPFEEIARVAGVSRTTLHRNFSSREDLARAVYEENLDGHAEFARSVVGRPDGIVLLFNRMLNTVTVYSGITRVMLQTVQSRDAGYGARALANFTLLLEDGRAAGLVRPGIGPTEIMEALHMADSAIADDLARGRKPPVDRIGALLRTALFDLDALERWSESNASG